MMSHCHFLMTRADQILERFHGAVFCFFFNHLLSLLSPGGKAFSPSCECINHDQIGIYTLEKLASGWSPSASPLLDGPHVIGWARPLDPKVPLDGVFELFGGCLIGKWDKRRPIALQLLSGLFFWRTFLVIVGGPFPLNEWWHVRS